MKFIFPQNYNFQPKFLGILDYSTIIFNLLWFGFIFFIVNIFIINLTFKIFLLIALCFPLILLSFSGFNGENVVYVFFYIIKFYIKPKLFLFKKFN